MAIQVNLTLLLAKRRMSAQELARRVGITQANLSILKTGKAKAIRFSTLDAICRVLDCQPGDILEYREEEKSMSNTVFTPKTASPGRPEGALRWQWCFWPAACWRQRALLGRSEPRPGPGPDDHHWGHRAVCPNQNRLAALCHPLPGCRYGDVRRPGL